MNTPNLNPWPIAISSFFAIAITGIVTFIVFATRNKMELVRPDYYDEEIRFQQQLDRLNRTRTLGAPIAVAYDSRQQSITIALPANQTRRPTSGRIHFYRPSDAALDQDLELAVNAEGMQRVDARKFRSGLWKVRVSWTVDGQDYFSDQSIVVDANSS
jgi:nitrogen fixation protein FixH